MSFVTTLAQLEALYGAPGEASILKEVAELTPEYRAIIAASPFATLATAGPEGLDCSPRGDEPGFVRAVDGRTLVMPDRKGNERIDSLRNIVRDPRVALLFLVPGVGTTLRVNGRAAISVDAELLASFAVQGKAPRSAIVITVEAVYFQCARAVLRSHLWDAARHVAPESLPSPGRILAALSGARLDDEAYDRAWPERAAKTLW
ncbi:pyridoxamine 5'-phosphate oxidase family protein [Hansschlegelia sp. KR7-227]|uniref:pyridoxamine 5'-phosphate oxidase family protein n=1 Tax=Hansschlegelia sp. KR7-227 TaxID=3400914 RepID=UPI003C0920C4